MDNRSRRHYAVLLIYDFVLFAFALIGVLSILLDFRFMVDEARLATTPFYFTFTGLSNMLLGVTALICFVYRLMTKRADLPKVLYLLKLTANALIAITFLTTACYLAPAAAGEWWKLYINGSLFNHLLTPLLGLAGFMIFEPSALGKRWHCLSPLPFMLAYGALYLIRCYSHVDASGHIDLMYDTYGLMRFGVLGVVLAFTGFIVASILFAFLLSLQNTHKKKNQQ